jgi:hypothetical protein
MRHLNLNWNYGYEVSEECEMYEFEGDSLSQDSYDLSLNEPESALECTIEMEIKHIACGEYVLLKNDYVVERGTYEECNATLNDYVEIYEWIDGMSNSRNQNN